MEKFFDAAPPKDWKKRDKQTEIMTDYRMCFDSMGAGHDENRLYLSEKYGAKIENIADLNKLGSELFGKLTASQKKADLVDIDKKIEDAASLMGRKGGSVKSERKTAANRENAKKGGRPRKVKP